MKTGIRAFRGYRPRDLRDDAAAGLIVAALTLPVAMGYAGVAGLPPVYGLYASMLPALGYALFASSPQMIYGMDATASAIAGSFLAALGIAAGTPEAVGAAAALSLFTAAFLFLFAALRLGRFAEYISMPVMSGFMSGTVLSILSGQLPKILGVSAAGNGFLASLGAVIRQLDAIHWPSLLIGLLTVALLLAGRRWFPKLPMALPVMALSTLCSFLFRLDRLGVAVVGAIPPGLPQVRFPSLTAIQPAGAAIGAGFVLAVVIFADSLMSAGSFAQRNGYALNGNREILAFGCGNLLSAFSGCSPTGVSVSRTAASEQFHGKTKMVSLVAAAIVTLVVSLLSGALYHMPQPMLGGVVFTALLGTVDVNAVRNLFRRTRREAIIWIASAAGVLLVGVLFGVLLGMILSFAEVILRMTKPPEAYLGRIPGRDGYFDMAAHADARPVPGAVIYRFSARLFFANADTFIAGVKKPLTAEHPRLLVIDASGINSVDATAAAKLKTLFEELDKQGVAWRIAGQIEQVNRQIRAHGLPVEGHIAKTIEEALQSLHEPK